MGSFYFSKISTCKFSALLYIFFIVCFINSCETETTPILAPTPLLAPTSLSAIETSATGTSISWKSVAEANQYEIDVSIDNFSTFLPRHHSLIFPATSSNEQVYKLGDLVPEAKYYVRIRAVSANKKSSDSETLIFCTTPVRSTDYSIVRDIATAYKLLVGEWRRWTSSWDHPKEIVIDCEKSFVLIINPDSTFVIKTLSETTQKFKFTLDSAIWQSNSYTLRIKNADSHRINGFLRLDPQGKFMSIWQWTNVSPPKVYESKSEGFIKLN